MTTLMVHMIPLNALHESPLNPRHHYDEAALQELANSIQAVGILTPLIVRPTTKKGSAQQYEIAAGHRRYRAGTIAAQTAMPCVVRDLTDEQFLEIVTIENLQRKDVHPLDEAFAFDAMMDPPYRWTVDTVAKKVSKPVDYIHATRKLLQLIPEAQELFWQGLIDKGHAVVLARLSGAEQTKVIGTKKKDYLDGGLFQAEMDLYRAESLAEAERAPIKARSVREVEAYIKRHIRFNAQQADSFLFPDTVAQVTEAVETKRKVIEITHEYLASDDVRHANTKAKVYGERAWKRADGKQGSKPCDHAVLGVIVSGIGQGQAFDVCIRKDKCTVHWKEEAKRRLDRSKAEQAGPSAQQRQREKEQAEEADRKRQAEQKQKVRRTLLEQLATKIKSPLQAEDLRMLAVDYMTLATNDFIDHDELDLLGFKDTYPNTKAVDAVAGKTKDVLGWMFLACVMSQSNNWHGDGDKALAKVLARYKIDLKAIEKAVTAELDSKTAVPAGKAKNGQAK